MSKLPNADGYTPDPARFRLLCDTTGLSRRILGRRLGLSKRTILRYLNNGAPYTVSYAVEQIVQYKLAAARRRQ